MHSLIRQALASRRVTVNWPRRLFLLLNLTPPLCVWLTGGVQIWAWAYAVLVHHILLIGMFVPRSNWLGPILNSLPTDEKIIWLTIDDGPSEDTEVLAKMLHELNVHATFFFQGKKLPLFPEALATLEKYGHSVANHTQNHDLAWFWLYAPWKVAHEVDAFQTRADALRLPLLPAFRCPAGIKNPFLHSILQRRGLTLVGWTIRAYDGVCCDQKKSIPRILHSLHPGAILLVHEGKNDDADQPASVSLIRELTTAIQAAGYRFA